MKSDDRFGLRPIWDEELKIYDVVAKICRKYNLRFFVVEGNAIGAVRHKGFVPWDDDIDLAMPRPDYEKFVQVAKKELPPNLKVVDWRNTPEFHLSFGKVQLTDREKVIEIEKKVGFQLSNGIYIDILVIDGCPDKPVSLLLYKMKLVCLDAMLRSKARSFSTETAKGKLLLAVGRILAWVMPWIGDAEKIKERIEEHMKSVPFESAVLTWRAGGEVRLRWSFSRRIWDGAVLMEYDEIQVPLPIGYDEYLRIQYGDYMKLPPAASQVPSHSISHRCPWWLGPTKG